MCDNITYNMYKLGNVYIYLCEKYIQRRITILCQEAGKDISFLISFQKRFYKYNFTFSVFACSISSCHAQKVVGVSEAYEDAANCLWLLTNSKPCANCKSPIQKNEGCNHMQCAKVRKTLHTICCETTIQVLYVIYMF